MIMGYPGSTDRFLSSHGVQQALDLYNPSVVDVRDLKLKTMKTHMDADPAVRIQYAAKYAQTANYWKYYIGQSKGLPRPRRLRPEESPRGRVCTAWIGSDADPAREGPLTVRDPRPARGRTTNSTDATVKGQVYSLEAGLIGCDLMLFAFRVAANGRSRPAQRRSRARCEGHCGLARTR